MVIYYPSFGDIHIFTKKNNFLSKSKISGHMNIKAGQKTKKNVNTLKKILVYVYGGPAEKSQNEKCKFLIL